MEQLKYNPLSNNFVIYNSPTIEPIKFESPLLEFPIDLDWASGISSNGSYIVKSNLPEQEQITQNAYFSKPEVQEIQVEEEIPEEKITSRKITKKEQKQIGLAIMNNLINRGYRPHEAAGIVGNLMAESSLNPGNSANDLGVRGGGLAAWRGDLFTRLKQQAKNSNIPWTNIDFQIDYLHNLLSQDNTQMNDVRNRLSTSNNPREASEAWAYYEKYAGYNYDPRTARKAGWSKEIIKQEHEKRAQFANEFYKLWKENS